MAQRLSSTVYAVFFRYELVNANATWIEGDDMLITVILTLIMCVLLFLMVWSAVFFLPWKGLMDFFPEEIKEKAIDIIGLDLFVVLKGGYPL